MNHHEHIFGMRRQRAPESCSESFLYQPDSMFDVICQGALEFQPESYTCIFLSIWLR